SAAGRSSDRRTYPGIRVKESHYAEENSPEGHSIGGSGDGVRRGISFGVRGRSAGTAAAERVTASGHRDATPVGRLWHAGGHGEDCLEGRIRGCRGREARHDAQSRGGRAEGSQPESHHGTVGHAVL